MTSVDAQPGEEPMRSGLTQTQLWVIVFVVVAQFLFLHGLVWRQLDDLDASILWSYATVFPLVAGVLLVSRRLGVRTFIMSTVEVIAIKFVLTATFLVIVLMVGGAPPKPTHGASLDAPVPAAEPEEPPPPRPTPSVIPDNLRGTVRGVVVDAAGRPVEGALVWIEEGLERWTFAPDLRPVRFTNDGHGFAPRLAAIEVEQPVELVATDGKLHTFAALTGHRAAWNFPVLASGAVQRTQLADPFGLTQVQCTVGKAGSETSARVLVVAHPFHVLTDRDGRFTLAGVPVGKVTIAAATEMVGPATMSLDVVAGATAEGGIKLP